MDAVHEKYIPSADIYLFNTGNARKAWLCFGCRYVPELKEHRFLVWAPNARQVHLVGDFNGWDRQSLPMEKREDGVWAVFVPRRGRRAADPESRPLCGLWPERKRDRLHHLGRRALRLG